MARWTQPYLRARRAIAEAGGLATIARLAHRWSVSHQTAKELTEQPGFPDPVDILGQSRIWLADEADEWRSNRAPQKPGPKPQSREAGTDVIEYVVVMREKPQIPINRHRSIEAAADYIVRERKFHEWTVLAQEANQIEVGTPYRGLRRHEKLSLEKRLFPTLYER